MPCPLCSTPSRTPRISCTVDAHRPRFADKRLELMLRVGSLPERVVGDGPAVARVLRNLLDNAHKFTREGRVIVEAHHEATGAAICLSVSDTGMGMAPEQVEALRRPFVRADNSLARAVDGAGLGLAIIDRILDQLGGDLTIDTALGEGSRFMVKLPATASDRRADDEMP